MSFTNLGKLENLFLLHFNVVLQKTTVAVISSHVRNIDSLSCRHPPSSHRKERETLETVLQDAERCRCLTHCAAYVTATVNIKHWTIWNVSHTSKLKSESLKKCMATWKTKLHQNKLLLIQKPVTKLLIECKRNVFSISDFCLHFPLWHMHFSWLLLTLYWRV